jgi:hypothetical protein
MMVVGSLKHLFLGLALVQTSGVFGEPLQITLMREGSTIVDATASINVFHGDAPTTVVIESGEDGNNIEVVLFPNSRLAEIEAEAAKNPNTRFRLSGEIFTYDNGNFLLIREVSAIGSFARRDSPTIEPLSPDVELDEPAATDDSVGSIIADLEAATGSLSRSIRSAANNPIDRVSPRTDGVRITNRRGNLVRNNEGAWVFVFVSDATGLSDPPCTVLPNTSSQGLFTYAGVGGFIIPVLVSGEVLTYHGHDFLLLRSWRRTHTADHLDG